MIGILASISKICNLINLILTSGIRSRNKVTRRELAEELKVDIRQITRYKEDLEYAGVNIAETRGKYGGYVLENKDYLLNLQLSDNEAIAISKAKDHLKNQGLHFCNDLNSAIDKIKAINPKDTAYNEEVVYTKGIKVKANQQEESQKWLTINDGIINNRKLSIKYADSKGTVTERIIHPYGLYTYYGSNYFIGYCQDKEALRQFKLVRIKEITLLKDKFNKPDFNIKEYLKNTIGLFNDNSYELKLKITYPYAMSFKEYSWAEEEEIEDHLKEGYIIYKAKLQGKTEIIPWIMGMGTACTVIEPAELRNDMVNSFKEAIKLYNM